MKKNYLLLLGIFFIFFIPNYTLATINVEVGAISISPSSPAQNEPCTITVRVTNHGSSDLTDYTGLSTSDISTNFKDFSITKTTLPTLPLKADTTGTYKYEGSFSDTGKKSLYFKLGSSYNQEYIEVVEPYDYQINSIKLYPPSPIAGEDTIIEVEAQNEGFISFKTNQDVGSVSYTFPNFEIDETVWPEVSYEDKIETDELYYYRYYGNFTKAGEVELSYSLDNGDRVEEKNEDNNNVSKTVEIFSPNDMDLEIYDIDFDIDKPLVDEEIEITVKVRNNGYASLTDEMGISTNGNASVNPRIEKGFFADFDDMNLIEQNHDDYPTIEDSFNPGDTFTYTYAGKFHFEGEKELTFTVNQKQQLTESDYTNDASTTKITIYKDEEARDKFKITSYDVKFNDSKTAEIYWTTDQDSTGAVWYKKKKYTSFVGETTSSGEDTTHSVTINDLYPDTVYEFKIIAENGTEEETLKDVFFTTPADDNIIITNGPNTQVNGSDITVTWDTNMVSYSQLFYRILGDSSYQNSSINLLTDEHSMTLSDLNDGTYEYYVTSASIADTSTDSETKTFTIKTATETKEEQTKTESGTETKTTTETDKQSEEHNTNQTQTEIQAKISITNNNLYNNLKGKIILTVEANGEAYYVNPSSQEMSYLGRPDDAFSVMRSEGVGITNANLEKIPIGLSETTGPDSDGDGLSDLLEDAIGTDKNKKDSDNDGHDDKTEISTGYNPSSQNTQFSFDNTFAKNQVGKIFLQVEGNGEAWYINPNDNKRYFLGRPADAFSVMRNLGLGISNSNFENLK